MNQIQTLFTQLLNERSWSWTLIAMVYLILGSVIRSWLMGPVLTASKSVGSGLNHEMKMTYLKKSFVGWIFFLAPIGIFALYGNQKTCFSVSLQDSWMALAVAACWVLSCLLHLQAFAIASVQTLKKALDEANRREY